jgi:hypothetical protein
MQDWPRSTVAPAAPLLSLEGVTAEWHVGRWPHCVATVRLLDDVHFTVRPGECVLVHHDDPAGARVLLAALAGHPALLREPLRPAPRRQLRDPLSGWRVAHTALRVRRSSIRADLVAPLLAAWRDAPLAPNGIAASGHRTPVLHLLRASRAGQRCATDHDAWRAWACAQREAGGALIIVSDEGPGDAIAGPVHRAPPAPGASARDEVHEPPPHYQSRDDASRTTSDALVRACALRHGRLDVVRAASDQYCWPSDAPLVVTG